MLTSPLLVERGLCGRLRAGRALKSLTEAAGVCPRTVRKWVERYRHEGLPGLHDRSSRPHRMRRPTPQPVVEHVEARREAAIAAGNGQLKGYVPDTSDAPSESSIDFVIDAVGAVTTRREASRITKPGSVIVHVGLLPGSKGLDVRKVTLQEITFTGSYCYTPQDFRETLDAMTSGRLGALDWFEERPIAKGTLAFHDLDEGRVSAAKVVLRPLILSDISACETGLAA